MKDLDVLCEIANVVRDIVREKYPYGGGGGIVKQGADGDPTKMIDQLAENAAIEWLDENDIIWNVLSEESGWIDRGGEHSLIFDPIDGTYNAVNGIPFYSTSLALGSRPDGEGVRAGVVLNIPTGTCFKAALGQGAFMDDIRISTRKYPEHDAVFSSFLGPGAMEENRRILSWPRRGRYFGSISLEICFVAKGSLDLFALFSRIPRITDIAAAHLILKESGGFHIKINGSNEWSEYLPGDMDNIKGILSIGDRNAVERIMEYSGVGT